MRNLSRKWIIQGSMRRCLIGLPVVAFIAGAALLLAQQSAPPVPQGQDGVPTFKGEVQVIQAPVTVLDHDGHIVNGLNALDFKLFDNGKEQKIVEDLSEHPISLVVAIQASANMGAILPEIRKVGPLFDNLVVGEDGEIAVIAFDVRQQILTNFTSDPDEIHKAFAGKDKSGNYLLRTGSVTSALNDATMAGVNMLKNRPKSRKRIMIVISENRDGGSGLHVRDVLEAMEFANVEFIPLNVSHLITSMTTTAQPTRQSTIPPGGQYLPNGQVNTQTTDQQNNNNGDWSPVIAEILRAVKGIFVPVTYPLDVYSHFTGGREFPFYTQKGLEQAISSIGQDLHNQYVLTYSPDDQAEAGYHNIRVEVDKLGLKVYTREGYWLAGRPDK